MPEKNKIVPLWDSSWKISLSFFCVLSFVSVKITECAMNGHSSTTSTVTVQSSVFYSIQENGAINIFVMSGTDHYTDLHFFMCQKIKKILWALAYVCLV